MIKHHGAIWIHDLGMQDQILQYINNTLFRCPSCKHPFFPDFKKEEFKTLKKHTMSVKINQYPEKYVAVENGKKTSQNQPDYYIHLQYTHTGAAPIFPFNQKTYKTDNTSGSEKVKVHRPDDNFTGSTGSSADETRVGVGELITQKEVSGSSTTI